MDKLIVEHKGGKPTVSNDGATILKLLDIVYPAAKTLVDIAQSQDAEVGDGTTSVVVLAAELLKQVRCCYLFHFTNSYTCRRRRISRTVCIRKSSSVRIAVPLIWR